MRFSDRIKSWIPSFTRRNTPTTYTSLKEFREALSASPKGYENPTIKICSRIIANTIASIGLGIYQEYQYGERNKSKFRKPLIEDFRWKALYKSPNGYSSAYDFWNTMEYNKQRKGDAYAIIHKFNGDRKVKSIAKADRVVFEVVPPEAVSKNPEIDGSGQIKYYFKTDEAEKVYYSMDVLHLKRTSENGIYSIDPADDLREYIDLSYYANATIKDHYEHGGQGQTFIKTTVTTGDVTKLRARMDEFRKEAAGYYLDKNNKKVKFDTSEKVPYPLLPGNSEPITVPNSQNDGLYLNTIQTSDLKIASYYGIPPHYLNIMQAQKNNNVETLQLDFKSSTVQHILKSNIDELELKLLTEDEQDNGYIIRYDTASIIELDHKTRMAGYESLQRTAGLQFNEVRSKEGLPPVEGGDRTYIFDQMQPLESYFGNSQDPSTN